MKHIVLACLLFALFVPLANAQTNGAVTLSLPSLRIPSDATLPSTCTVGDIYMDTDATSGARFYLCESANTWVAQGGAGGATGVTATSVFGTDNAVLRADGTSRGAQSSGCSIGDTDILTCPGGFVAGTAGTGALTMLQGTVPSAPSAGEHTLYFDSADSLLKSKASSSTVTTYTTTTGTQSLTNKTLDCEATGNACTIVIQRGGDLVGVAGGTAGHVWNDDPLSTACTPLAVVGTNQSFGVCTFPDSDGEIGRSLAFLLPTGFGGTTDADITWKTTGTGNARFRIQTICYATNEAMDSAFSNSTYVTAAAGTSGRINKVNMPSIVTTGCAAGERMIVRFSRNRTEASDTLTAALDVEKVLLNIRVTQ